MKIAIGADHGGFELKGRLTAHLREKGHSVLDMGTSSNEAVDYPVFARAVAETVATGRAERGVMIDGAGIGSSMVANKVPGVRAAMAYDLSSARNGREHNDANVLTLGAGLIGPNLAAQIVDVFLETDCVEPRHQRRVAMIDAGADGSAPATGSAAAGVPSALAGALPDGLGEADIARIVDRLAGLLGSRGLTAEHGPCVTSSPETARHFIGLGAGGLTARAGALGDVPGRIPEDVARYIDHTILRPATARDDVLKVCAEAREHGFRSVCVNPCWAKLVAEQLRGSPVLTCSVIGFPRPRSRPWRPAAPSATAPRKSTWSSTSAP